MKGGRGLVDSSKRDEATKTFSDTHDRITLVKKVLMCTPKEGNFGHTLKKGPIYAS